MEKLKTQAGLLCHRGAVTLSPDLDADLPENVAEIAVLDCMPKVQRGRTVGKDDDETLSCEEERVCSPSLIHKELSNENNSTPPPTPSRLKSFFFGQHLIFPPPTPPSLLLPWHQTTVVSDIALYGHTGLFVCLFL